MVPKFVLIFDPLLVLKEKAGHRSLTFRKLGTKTLRSHREEEEQAFYLNSSTNDDLATTRIIKHRNPTPQSKPN